MLLLALAMAAAMADTQVSPQPQGPAPSAPAASQPAATDADKVICRTEEVTGSHFDRRVCMTRAQWEQQSQAAQNLERQMHDAPAAGPGGAPT